MGTAVSVVIPTKDGMPDVQETLAAVFAQHTERAFEVLVIDSGSTDGTVEAVRAFPARLLAIAPEEFGHGRTRNLGAQLAEGDIVVYLSQDAVPADARWLEELVAPLSDPRVAAVYGRQMPKAEATPLMRYFHSCFYPDHRFEHTRSSAFSFRRILFSNVNSAVRRAVLLEHPFADDIIMSEDQEFAHRVLAHGHTIVYEPSAAVWHSHNYRLAELFRRNFDSAYSLRSLQRDGLLARARDGLAYLLGELRYLAASREWRWVPMAVLWELTRAVAFLLGPQADRLPRGLRRRMSLHREYWRARELQPAASR